MHAKLATSDWGEKVKLYGLMLLNQDNSVLHFFFFPLHPCQVAPSSAPQLSVGYFRTDRHVEWVTCKNLVQVYTA